MARPNVFDVVVAFDGDDPPGYLSACARVGDAAGGTAQSVRVFDVPAGESLCPYHYEFVEEWLLVLEGDVSVRGPDGIEDLRRGDLVCFPAGPAGAHKVTNRGSASTRVLMWSSAREPAVAVYPDSDKIGVWPGHSDDNLMVRRADAQVDYWDGER
jgi:uncharacterized cupin superfamily protein